MCFKAMGFSADSGGKDQLYNNNVKCAGAPVVFEGITKRLLKEIAALAPYHASQVRCWRGVCQRRFRRDRVRGAV